MDVRFDPCLAVSVEEFQNDRRFAVIVLPSLEELWEHFANDCASLVAQRNRDNLDTVLVFPVGPLNFRVLAGKLLERNVSLQRCTILNMDEYCTDEGDWIPYEHPLSFRALMDRDLYHLLPEGLRPALENRIFPDPHDPSLVTQLVERRGIDVCYGGIGLDGHFAFNCPEPAMSVEQFAGLPTRVLDLATVTRCQTAIGSMSGDVESVPHKAITIGMRELLAAREVKIYLMRHWQASLVRRCLYGEVTAKYPASLFQSHLKMSVIVTASVAEPPRFALG